MFWKKVDIYIYLCKRVTDVDILDLFYYLKHDLEQSKVIIHYQKMSLTGLTSFSR